MKPETTEIAKTPIKEQISGNDYVIHVYKESEKHPTGPVETLVIELLDLAGRSLSIFRLHVNFGDLCYEPYSGRDKVYKSEREVYRALGKLAQEKLIRGIRMPAEEIQEKRDREKWS